MIPPRRPSAGAPRTASGRRPGGTPRFLSSSPRPSKRVRRGEAGHTLVIGHPAGRAPRRAADPLRAGHQQEDRAGARPDDPSAAAVPGGPGDRVRMRRRTAAPAAFPVLRQDLRAQSQGVLDGVVDPAHRVRREPTKAVHDLVTWECRERLAVDDTVHPQAGLSPLPPNCGGSATWRSAPRPPHQARAVPRPAPRALLDPDPRCLAPGRR